MIGNHDVTLDEPFYTEHGLYFHNQHPQDSQLCQNLVKQYKDITFLTHESATIRLTKEDGPRTTFKVFGSPYSPQNGLWAFGYSPEDAKILWDQVPLDTDVVITHTPAKYHRDESKHGGAGGCEILRQALWRVRPSLAICGHIHEGRGVERVLWDLASPNVKYKELQTVCQEDPGVNNKKHSLFNFSHKSPEPLQNSGPWDGSPVQPVPNLQWQGGFEHTEPAIRGQGGLPPPGHSDMEVLNGRLGRKETCVINAAMMATSWPYKHSGGNKYNKPIVIDIDLHLSADNAEAFHAEDPQPAD